MHKYTTFGYKIAKHKEQTTPTAIVLRCIIFLSTSFNLIKTILSLRNIIIKQKKNQKSFITRTKIFKEFVHFVHVTWISWLKFFHSNSSRCKPMGRLRLEKIKSTVIRLPCSKYPDRKLELNYLENDLLIHHNKLIRTKILCPFLAITKIFNLFLAIKLTVPAKLLRPSQEPDKHLKNSLQSINTCN